uniref:hypothetical protein n=1 Tax=Methylomonas koyamae TaxID=702114 RepID=UPI001581BF42|nr:hypothetical protein [Methylomonas koyamae]
MLKVMPEPTQTQADALETTTPPTFVCPDCGAAMIIIEILTRKPLIRAPPPQVLCHEPTRLPKLELPTQTSSAKADTETLGQRLKILNDHLLTSQKSNPIGHYRLRQPRLKPYHDLANPWLNQNKTRLTIQIPIAVHPC